MNDIIDFINNCGAGELKYEFMSLYTNAYHITLKKGSMYVFNTIVTSIDCKKLNDRQRKLIDDILSYPINQFINDSKYNQYKHLYTDLLLKDIVKIHS